jgi:hypothetical protein
MAEDTQDDPLPDGAPEFDLVANLKNPDWFGPDYELSVGPDVEEIYGPKFNVYVTGLDLRIAFGTAHPHRDPITGIVPKSRYKMAVYLPIQCAVDLVAVLRSNLMINVPLTPEQKAMVCDAIGDGK